VGIRVTEPGVLERITTVLPPDSEVSRTPVVPDLFSLVVGGRDARSSVRRFNLLYLGASLVARTHDLDEALRILEEHLHALVAVQSPDRLFISATVVSWRGQLVLIPQSHPGDCTVLRTMLGPTARYYSERYAVVDARGLVHPYLARPAAAITDARPISHTSEKPPALPIGLVVVQCVDRPDTPAVRELTRAQVALRLLPHTIISRIRPRFALALLTRALDHAAALEATLAGIPACLQQGGRHGPPCAARESHRSAARQRVARL
jgi:hypothetical protein